MRGVPKYRKPKPPEGLRVVLARRFETKADRWRSVPHYRIIADALERGRDVILPTWAIPRDQRPAGREQPVVRMLAGGSELSWEPYEHVDSTEADD